MVRWYIGSEKKKNGLLVAIAGCCHRVRIIRYVKKKRKGKYYRVYGFGVPTVRIEMTCSSTGNIALSVFASFARQALSCLTYYKRKIR